MQASTKQIMETAIAEQSTQIPELMKEEVTALQDALVKLDLLDRRSIIYFGFLAQEKLNETSKQMIDALRHKDIAATAVALHQMLASVRGFDMAEFNPSKKLAWWQSIFAVNKPLARFIQKYEDAKDQIDNISHSLEEHKDQLMTNIVSLDKLYDANLDYLRNLEICIKAGETKLESLEESITLAYEKKARTKDMLATQDLKKIRGFRDELKRRMCDLRLSRQVAMQSLPSIGLIQENDKSFISKITSILVNTIALWKKQLAQTVAILKSHGSTNTLKDTANLNKQMQRDIFDIESIKTVNQAFISTLNDSLHIAEASKSSRKEALLELQQTEKELKNALLAVKTKAEELPELITETSTKAKEKTKETQDEFALGS